MPKSAYPAPPRADAEETHYTSIRECFRAARYYDREVCEYLGFEDLGEMVRLGPSLERPLEIEHALAALCHLFLLSRAVTEDTLRWLLGDGFLDAAIAVDLIAPYSEHPGAYRALAAVYPLRDAQALAEGRPENFWVASDRLSGTLEEREAQPDDVVFCPLAATGKSFLDLLPRTPCGRFLEVCGGCGPAALLATGFATETVSSDLAGRSVAFSAFVARLNGKANMKAHQGGSYEGLSGTFDRIAAHPPYMPALGPAEIYYSGGSNGMDITESLVRGLPRMLNPGGIFFAMTMLFEGPGKPAESLVREWLGEDQASYDVMLFPVFFHSLHEAAQRVAIKAAAGYAGVEQAFNLFSGQGFQNAVVGSLAIRRHDGTAPAVTARRRAGEPVDWRHVLWSLDAERLAASDADGSLAMGASYRVRNTVEMIVTHRPSEEGFAAAGFRIKNGSPFVVDTEVQGWMSYLIARADGALSGRQLLDSCVEDKMVLPETPPAEFARLLWTFVGGAIIESSACPLPVTNT